MKIVCEDIFENNDKGKGTENNKNEKLIGRVVWKM